MPKALACAMVGLGHDVTILTRDEPERASAMRESMVGMPGAEGVEIATVPRGGRFDALLNRHARDWAVREGGSYDFAHLHSMWSPIPHGAARGLAAAGVPYTLCPHGMLDYWTMRQSRAKKLVHLAIVSRKTMRGCAFIHALNAHEAACVDRFGFGAPCEVVSNGIFASSFEMLPSPDVFLDAHQALRGKRYILFLGRLHFKKGLDYLAHAFIEIAARHPDVMLAVVGPDGGAGGAFSEQISRAGLSDRVVMPGPIYGPEKLGALVGAACFCLPSRQEGFSVAICEALACGLPVVISEACHFPEVEGAGAGVVCGLDASAVAGGLDQVLAEPDQASRMGESGRRLVMERYTWPAIAARCVSLYESHAVG